MSKNDLIPSNKKTVKTLQAQQKLPLWKKVEYAKSKIREFMQIMDGKVYVAYSGGVDSEVLLHLVRSMYPDVIAVFSNTTNEYPEIIRHVKKTPNVHWVRPEVTLKEVVKEHGFPLVSKKVARRVKDLRNPTPNNIKMRSVWLDDNSIFKIPYKWRFLVNESFDTTSKCCDLLKKKPLLEFEKVNKVKPFIGIYAENSKQRENTAIHQGCNVYAKGKEQSRPMMIWTKQDVWDYIKINSIDYCPIYDDKVLEDGTVIKGEKNTGCMYCGFGYQFESKDKQDRFERNRLRRPKQYKNYMKLENGGVTFREALDLVKNAPNIRKKDAPYIPLDINEEKDPYEGLYSYTVSDLMRLS